MDNGSHCNESDKHPLKIFCQSDWPHETGKGTSGICTYRRSLPFYLILLKCIGKYVLLFFLLFLERLFRYVRGCWERPGLVHENYVYIDIVETASLLNADKELIMIKRTQNASK